MGNDVKNYAKCRIASGVDFRIILYLQSVKKPRHDVKFAIVSIMNLKKNTIRLIIVDKAYYTNFIMICINEEKM